MARARRNRLKAPKRELPKLPSLPRVSINWRLVTAGIAVSTVGLVSFALGRELVEIPVRSVAVEGTFQRVTKLEIVSATQIDEGQSLLTLDLEDVRRRVTAIDWVDTITLQRVWPDTLKITYTEHQPAARWGDNGLLNTRGELFARDVRREYVELPKLVGPEGSHRRVAETYLEVREGLARASLMLDSLEMDARGAFSIHLVGGVSVRLGRDNVAERIARFFEVAVPALAAELDRIAHIDLRYRNGFAVGWRDPEVTNSSVASLGNNG